MADTELQDLTELTTPIDTDIIYVVDDPGVTPLSRKLTIANLFANVGINGIDVLPGSDADADLITVGVTGAPKINWDESDDEFDFNKGIHVYADNSANYVVKIEQDGAGDTAINFFETGAVNWYAGIDNTDNSFKIEDSVLGTNNNFVITPAGNVGIGVVPTANMTGIALEGGALTLKEITTPTADTNYGKIYTKTDNALYFQDGAGVEHTVTIS